MPSRKKAASKKKSQQGPSVATVSRQARARVGEVIAFREAERAKRAEALEARPAGRRAFAPAAIPARTLDFLGPRESAGVLIAEGDSWFDYPLHDVLRLLEDHHAYDVESVAHMGDRVEQMAYTQGQFEQFARRLEKLLRQGRAPRAILLSGGGNDIAGDEFALLLNHAASSLPTINQDIVNGLIHVRLRDAYVFLIAGLTAITKSYLPRPIPILTHGYDYPIPDGRGFLGGWGPLPGPWLRPGFYEKGHGDLARNTAVMKDLIDAFNEMLMGVSSVPQFGHVHYVNLRRTLKRDDWANELHPTGQGFAAVARKFDQTIAGL